MRAPQTWHHGLIADWWANFNLDAPEVELYAPYLRRQEAERRLIDREDRLAIPDSIDFTRVPGLSREMQHRLAGARPTSLGSAGRIPGVTPAAIAALAVHLRRGAAG